MATSPISPDMREVLRNLRNPKLRVGDGRQHRRVIFFLLATIQHNRYTFKYIVDDMRIGGCRVSNTNGPFTVGETVIINIPEQKMTLNGMVMWARGKMAGLCFNLS